MPPITVTETLEPSIKTTSYDINLKHKKKTILEKINIAPELSPYDQMLNAYKDPPFMGPIRKIEKKIGFVTPIRWINTTLITTLHLLVLAGLGYCIHYEVYPTWNTVFFAWFMGQVAGFGVTAGAHRHWSHRSYKAKWPLKILLLICYSAAGQNSMYEWVRDHRVHHKHSETTADPHDANRGFFFSHVGWLMMKKHPDVITAGCKIDMSDIQDDPFIKFHTRYFMLFKLTACLIIPTLIPWYMWYESADMAILSTIIRYAMSLHFTWSVNSFAHLWGNKPYDIHIMPSENRGVSLVAMGEGWHNYHHTFPWDYKAAELGVANNITTDILNQFAKIGWAYDLKQASPSLVKAIIRNRGDQHIKDANL